MHSKFARQSSGSRSGGFAASSRRPRQSFLSRDLWVQGNDALPSYREGNTCASPGLGERTDVKAAQKVHQWPQGKYISLMVGGNGGLASGRGSARGISPSLLHGTSNVAEQRTEQSYPGSGGD